MRHPALVLSYNRLDSAFNICAQLAQYGAVEIFVSIDGGKDKTTINGQRKLISRLRVLSYESGIPISIRHASENLGVSAGVISGIDWFFENVESGYIFEDDLIFTSDFLDYSDIGLERFREDQTVWVISGNQYIESNPKSIWTNYPLIWGWATWNTKWEEFRNAMSDTRLTFNDRSISFSVRQFWKVGYSRAVNGRLDSWAVPFASQMLSKGKIGLLPPVNLVANVGVDNFASHTLNQVWHTAWKIGRLSDFPGYFNLWNEKREPGEFINQNKLLEKKIYRIRIRHHWLNIYSFLFDSIRFKKSSNLQVKLANSRNILVHYYSYKRN